MASEWSDTVVDTMQITSLNVDNEDEIGTPVGSSCVYKPGKRLRVYQATSPSQN